MFIVLFSIEGRAVVHVIVRHEVLRKRLLSWPWHLPVYHGCIRLRGKLCEKKQHVNIRLSDADALRCQTLALPIEVLTCYQGCTVKGG